MHREKPTRRPRFATAMAVCLGGGTAVAAALAVIALPALPATAATAADSGPHAPSDPGAQLTTGMMPASSPDAAVARALSARTAVSPRALTAGTNANGVDVADYQHPSGTAITWANVRASGRTFAIVKATEGTSYVNSYVTSDSAGARVAGLTVGLYHFARPTLTAGSPTADAVAEADHFAAQVNAVGGTQLPPTLDLEVTGGLGTNQLAAWTGTFLTRLQADTGRRPMIYTGPYFWNDDVASSAFGTYALWEAEYTSAAAPMAVRGWSSWSMWQYTDGSFGSPAAVPGITGTVDRDEVNGGAAALGALASGSTGSVAPFTGTASAAAYPDGTLVRVVGTSTVYVIAGRAPLELPTLADATSKAVRLITAAQFDTLRSSPLDGTFLVAHETNAVYRVAGGAPIYLNTLAPFPGAKLISVGEADINRAGQAGMWSHLSYQPADGTFIEDAVTHAVFRMAGGAPVYVSSWAYFGGGQPYTGVSDYAIVHAAGTTGSLSHLAYTPAVGTDIADPTAGSYWVIDSAGALTPTANSGQAFVVEGDSAIVNRGKASPWNHLR
jgi:GH25 family lysozyme M1 (1,4-beta-N-acetylmuramidase)